VLSGFNIPVQDVLVGTNNFMDRSDSRFALKSSDDITISGQGEGVISFGWNMFPQSQGSTGISPYGSVSFVLLKFDDVTKEWVPHGDAQGGFLTQAGQAVNGSVEWKNLPSGEYKVVTALLDSGAAGDIYVAIGVGEVSWTTEDTYKDVPVFGVEYAAGGNVIADGVLGAGERGVDHKHVYEDGELVRKGLSEAAFVSQWVINDPYTGEAITIGGEENPYEDGMFVYSPEGANYTLTFWSNGKYELATEALDAKMDIKTFAITYTVVDGDLSDTANLFIGNVIDKANPADGFFHGGENDDIIFGGIGDAVIYGGLGNDIMYGGKGTNIFAWEKDHLLGNHVDSIMDFKFGTDALRYSELIDLNEGNLLNLLNGGVLSVSWDNDVLTIKVEAGEIHQTVNVHIVEGAGDVATAMAGNTEAQAQLLAQMIITHSNT
jgi:hypothetical protein